LRLIVTGGGTGGHVFPALEIARTARERGDTVLYLGSLRGMERRACERAGIEFLGFPSQGLPKRPTLAALRIALQLLRSSNMAKRALQRFRPDVVFSTGGYASAPVVAAARSRRVPYVLHEQNTVPGRVNRMFAGSAKAVAVVFRTGHERFAPVQVVRTGMPIRRELRDCSQGRLPFSQASQGSAPIVFVVGGSQGAARLNDVAIATATRMARHSIQWLHVTGPDGYHATLESMRKLAIQSQYEARAYLEAEEMATALFSCTLVLGRSGGSLAEVAAFRKPSILVPYPFSMGDHQRLNALEFQEMGAALIIENADLTPATLESRILLWIEDAPMRARAQEALAEWDIPDATDRIMSLIVAAAQ